MQHRDTGWPYKQWLLCTPRNDLSPRICATHSFTCACHRAPALRERERGSEWMHGADAPKTEDASPSSTEAAMT